MRRRDRSATDRSARQVVASKALLAATTLLAVSAVVSPLLGVPAALIAWRVPDLALARLARRTLAAADREIPGLLDLLAVAPSAGGPPPPPRRRRREAGPGAPAARAPRPTARSGCCWPCWVARRGGGSRPNSPSVAPSRRPRGPWPTSS